MHVQKRLHPHSTKSRITHVHSGNRALQAAGFAAPTMTAEPSVGGAAAPLPGPVPAHDVRSADPLDVMLRGEPAKASCPLAPSGASVSCARRFSATTLREWGMPDLRDDVELVVSELVTNALSHGLAARCEAAPDDSHRSEPASPIRLTLARRGANVICMVEDASGEAPIERSPGGEAEAGRGLQLVASFSRRWGWSRLADGGKVVWALFHCPGTARS